MQKIIMDYLWSWLNLKTISLASLLVLLWAIIPVFLVGLNFFQEVKAHGITLKDHEIKFKENNDYMHMLNEKINILLINDGIKEYRIEAIENHYKQKGE